MGEMKSTRCHAVVMNGCVKRNVIVGYPDHFYHSRIASLGQSIIHSQSVETMMVAVNRNQSIANPTKLNCQLNDITVTPFTGEVHSTDDFNGVIAFAPLDYELPSDFSIHAETFSHDTDQLAQILPIVQPDTPIKLLFLTL